MTDNPDTPRLTHAEARARANAGLTPGTAAQPGQVLGYGNRKRDPDTEQRLSSLRKSLTPECDELLRLAKSIADIADQNNGEEAGLLAPGAQITTVSDDSGCSGSVDVLAGYMAARANLELAVRPARKAALAALEAVRRGFREVALDKPGPEALN